MLLLAGTSSSAQTLNSPVTTVPTAAPLFATAPIVLDGQTLFSVAVSASATGTPTAEARANDINGTIAQIIGSTNDDHPYDGRSLRIAVQRQGSVDIVSASDADHKTALPIATVTSADAASAQETQDAVAAEWQERLQGALVRAIAIREPRVQQRHLIQATIVIAVLLAITIAAGLAVRRLTQRIGALVTELDRKQDTLADAQAAPAADAHAADEHQRRRTRAILIGTLRPAQRLIVLRALRDLLVWGMFSAWCVGAAWAALQFPQTTPLGHTFAHNAVVIASIFIVTGIIDRVLTILIGRLPLVWELRNYHSTEQRDRETLRMPTVVRAMNGFKTFVLVFLALLSALTQIGIPVGSVVTIGGVAAIAVSLAAQNLIRDVVSGFLVLSEDQFVLGDFVTINGASGIVERLTLRMVQLRDGSGGLVTISHSAATSVINHSRNWSRLDYAVAIDPGADPNVAIDLVRKAAGDLAADSMWRDAISGPVEWIGVDGISRDGIVIRARVRTAPLRQFALQRELNLRVSNAFREAKIGFGAPVAAVSPSS